MIVELSSQLTNHHPQIINQPQSKPSSLTYSFSDIIDMLTMWGRFHRYKSRCGYQRKSAFFADNNPTKSHIFIDEHIDFIDEKVLLLKASSSDKLQQQYMIIEAYYKGIDLAVDGYDWSQKLTIRDIASYLNLPKSTVLNRKKAAEQFIFNEYIKKVNFN